MAAVPPSVPSFGRLLPPPPVERRGIPLYYDKSEDQTRTDVYERFDELVTRQTLLHLADDLHGGYPFLSLSEYIDRWLPHGQIITIADIGCSVGRLIGDIAVGNPQWDCYGIDFSYQMLRQAKEHWKDGSNISPNISRYGFPPHTIRGKRTPNLHFALADAASLPFPDDCLSVVFTTFLIDRVDDPILIFAECRRVLGTGGTLIVVSPLNFLKAGQWEQSYPAMKMIEPLLRSGWQLFDLTDPMLLSEPLDARGNVIVWNAVAFVLQKMQSP